MSDGSANVVGMDEPIEMLCKDCDAVVAFVQPVTEDPVEDLMCVLCGTAITFAGVLLREQLAA